MVGSPSSPCREGTGMTTTTSNGDTAYERGGGTADTDNNTPDFQHRKPGNPAELAGRAARPTRRRR